MYSMCAMMIMISFKGSNCYECIAVNYEYIYYIICGHFVGVETLLCHICCVILSFSLS